VQAVVAIKVCQIRVTSLFEEELQEVQDVLTERVCQSVRIEIEERQGQRQGALMFPVLMIEVAPQVLFALQNLGKGNLLQDMKDNRGGSSGEQQHDEGILLRVKTGKEASGDIRRDQLEDGGVGGAADIRVDGELLEVLSDDEFMDTWRALAEKVFDEGPIVASDGNVKSVHLMLTAQCEGRDGGEVLVISLQNVIGNLDRGVVRVRSEFMKVQHALRLVNRGREDLLHMSQSELWIVKESDEGMKIHRLDCLGVALLPLKELIGQLIEELSLGPDRALNEQTQ
jgi:hypothetical protein